MIVEKNFNSKSELIANIKDELKTEGFIVYKQSLFIFDISVGLEKTKQRNNNYTKNINLIQKKFEDLTAGKTTEFPDLSKANKPYFVIRANCSSIKNTYNPEDYFVDSLEELLGLIKEGKVIYPPQFYKFITERKDWEVTSDEVYWDDYKLVELYHDFLKEIDDIVNKLKELKSRSKENTPEFKSLLADLKTLSPLLAKEF